MSIKNDITFEEPSMTNLLSAIQTAINKANEINATFSYGDFDVNKTALRITKERLQESLMWAERLVDKI